MRGGIDLGGTKIQAVVVDARHRIRGQARLPTPRDGGPPAVASRIGGIQDQIVDGQSGLLLDDPADLAAYGAAVCGLLHDPARAEQIGHAAQERVRDDFLSVRSLLQYLALIQRLLAS